MGYRIVRGDVLSFCRHYRGPKFHALLCDPPYHLTSPVSKSGSRPNDDVSIKKYNAHNRGGFMGKRWDGGDIAFRSETWKSLASLLYPGAFLIAFSGSRGWHRQAVAMEDAGLIIHPMIGWLYASGFPKATRLGVCNCAKRIEKSFIETGNGIVMSGMQKEILQTDGVDTKVKETLLLQDMQWSSELSKESETKFVPISERNNAASGRKKRGKKLLMEGGNNLSPSSRKLPSGEIYPMPIEVPSNGQKGRIHNGAQIDNGTDDRKIVVEDRSSTPQGSQPAQQQHREPRTMARQSESQVGRTWKVCDKCGKQIIDGWEGHRYGLQALKPALEPIIIAQVPYDGKLIDCITRTGAGALNIDGTRIGNDAGWSYPKGAGGLYAHEYQNNSDIAKDWNSFSTKEDNKPIRSNSGRWPANFVLDTDVAQLLNEQSGLLKSGQEPEGGFVRHKPEDDFSGVYGGGKGLYREEQLGGELYGDAGGASRFFFNADWNAETEERLGDTLPVLYQSKASRSERDAGLDGKRCGHPTVKPISLAKWLATLLLPPVRYSPRRILIPFSGVSSEMIGAHQAGWECIVGIEGEREYVELGEARMKYWTSKDVQPELI